MNRRKVELFSGGGGFVTGSMLSGMETLAAIEYWGPAAQTLRNLLGDERVIEDDANEVDYRRFYRTRFVTGSPPCQDWSTAHPTIKGPSGSRNGWPAAIRAVREIEPEAFLFENVAGFMREQFFDARMEIFDGFRSLGYCLRYGLFDAADYGAGCERVRAMVYGFRPWRSFPGWPKPTHVRPERACGGRLPWVSMAETWASYGIENWSDDRALVPSFKQPKLHKNRLRTIQARDIGRTCNTLTTVLQDCCFKLPDGRAWYVPPIWRQRLMGFPDDHPFAGCKGDHDRMTGNAVQVDFAKIFCDWLLR